MHFFDFPLKIIHRSWTTQIVNKDFFCLSEPVIVFLCHCRITVKLIDTFFRASVSEEEMKQAFEETGFTVKGFKFFP